MADEDAARQPLWRARRAEDLVWAAFDDIHVVYHRPSGKTHFLNTASARLLRDVLTVPRSAAAAAEALAASEQAAVAPEFLAAVAQSLVHLERLGLAEPA